MVQKIILAGEKSYSAVVDEIFQKIQKAEASTLLGSELLKEVYANLNESITPLLTLKPFITGAEKIAGDDVKLSELIGFLKKSITGNADLNFLINLCKEEHYAELGRMSHPSPKSTIKDIEDHFNDPGTVIEEGIRAGVFDNLKSKLLNKIKSDLQVAKPQVKLNESEVLFSGNLVKYSPIGLRYEDIEKNRLVMLTESGAFEMNRETKSFSVLEDSINISAPYRFLMNAINSAAYSPETNIFSLNENWDFDLQLRPDGKTFINDKEIPNEKVGALLLESIRTYVTDSSKVVNFNKINYLKDADNFIALMENCEKLIRFDTLEVIKNLNENSFVIIEKKMKTPKILFTSKNDRNISFDSFMNLSESISTLISTNISNMFLSQIELEKLKIDENNKTISKLFEEQNQINVNIQKVRNLKTIAEDDSPAMKNLNEQEKMLKLKLDENLKSMNSCKNDFKLV